MIGLCMQRGLVERCSVVVDELHKAYIVDAFPEAMLGDVLRGVGKSF